jgi:hypothetical protein
VEALMKEAAGGDNLAVGWLKPGQTGSVPSEVVPGSVLSPFVPGGNSTPTGNPDLTVTDINWSPANPVSGQTVTFSATVKNNGGATSAGTIVGVAFIVNGSVVNWSDTHTSSLAGGASITLTANGGPSGVGTWTAGGSGNYTVLAYVDDINRFPNETNESNNQYSETMTVSGSETTNESKDNLDLNSFVVYPIPVSGKSMSIKYNSPNKTKADIKITNLAGVTMVSKSVGLAAGDNNITLDTKNLSSGSYIVSMVANKVRVNKIVVIN